MLDFSVLLVAKPASRDRKACRNAPCMFGHPICLDTPNICLDDPLYVLMMCGCPIHTQHKESMFCQTKVCPYVPIHLDAPYVWMHLLYVLMPPYVWTPPTFWMPLLCLDSSCMFGNPLHVWMSPSMFGHPHLFGWPNIFGCTHCMFGCPHMFGCPPICLDSAICLDVPIHVCGPNMYGCPHMFG